jgi:selenide,water dikinase
MASAMKRLTHYAACAGCASKFAAGELASVLGALPLPSDPRVQVDYRHADDAGVFKLDDQRALVQTVDFFTPIVDDPVTYGRIAAANAVSDVYAMGGRPLTALAVATFPKDGDPTVLATIFRGGLEVLTQAGAALLGGHTVQDPEIKFGYAVTGEIDPNRVWTNAGAQPGDQLILTKPLGTGVIATAIKFDRAPAAAAEAAIRSMTALNRAASEAFATLPAGAVHACTDVTGFGLAGHGSEMARASGCVIEIDRTAVPTLPGAMDLLDENTPGGARTNQDYVRGCFDAEGEVDSRQVRILFDPQTSGGLLVAVAPEALAPAVAALRRQDVPVWIIGRVAHGAPCVRVRQS